MNNTKKMTAERVVPLDPVARTELQAVGGGFGQVGGPVGGSLDSVVPCRPAGIPCRPLDPRPQYYIQLHSVTVNL
jgi:hypothetical protein